MWSRVLAAVVSLAVAGVGLANANENPRVVPPGASAFGATYGEWAAAWWHWSLGFPIDGEHNPVLDPTGALCAEGQDGPVWFLAGTFGWGDPLVRTCTVPTGKALFFPVVSVFWGSTLPEEPQTAEEIYDQIIGPWISGVTLVQCEIDGRPVEALDEYLVTSPLFFPNVEASFGVTGPVPSLTSGYHLLIAPLAVGEHEIRIRSAIASDVFGASAIDVTYQLTVR